MSNKVKDIDIKPHMLLFQWCCPYENFDPNNIKIDEKVIQRYSYNGIRCLVLFDYWWFDEICDKIKYLISETSSITDSINDNFWKIRIDSYNSIPIEKILTFIMLKHSLSQLLMRI